MPLRAASFEEWWERTSALAGPLSRILASLPEPAGRALVDRVREAAAPYTTATGLEFQGHASRRLKFPGVSLIATARR